MDRSTLIMCLYTAAKSTDRFIAYRKESDGNRVTIIHYSWRNFGFYRVNLPFPRLRSNRF